MQQLARLPVLSLLALIMREVCVASAVAVQEGDAASIRAIEARESMDRETAMEQMAALKRLAADQLRLKYREQALMTGRPLLHDSEHEVPQFAKNIHPLASEAASVAGLPLGARERRLNQLLAAGVEVLSKENMALEVLSREQSELDDLVGELVSRTGTQRLADQWQAISVPAALAAPIPDNLVDASFLSRREAGMRRILLRGQAETQTLVGAEQTLDAEVSFLEAGDFRNVSGNASGNSTLNSTAIKELPPFPLKVPLGIVMLLLALHAYHDSDARLPTGLFCWFCYTYWLLARGFPAKLSAPLAIDVCLAVILCLIGLMFVSIGWHLFRESWCLPPDPIPDDGAGAAGEQRQQSFSGQAAEPAGTASQQPGLSRSLSGQVTGALDPQTATDHQIVEENRRMQAEEVLGTRPFFVITALTLAVALWLSGIVVWFEGILIWVHYHKDPCDTPLSLWLLYALILPVCGFCCLACLGTVSGVILAFYSIGLGLILWTDSKTCYATNPETYHFVQMYLLYLPWLTLSNALSALLGVVGIAEFLREAGFLDGTTPGRSGLIDELEDVSFTRGMGACPICTDDFCPDKAIKRTPCNHTFHKDCLKEWLEKWNHTCPICRADLDQTASGDRDLECMAGEQEPARAHRGSLGSRSRSNSDEGEGLFALVRRFSHGSDEIAGASCDRGAHSDIATS